MTLLCLSTILFFLKFYLKNLYNTGDRDINEQSSAYFNCLISWNTEVFALSFLSWELLPAAICLASASFSFRVWFKNHLFFEAFIIA